MSTYHIPGAAVRSGGDWTVIHYVSVGQAFSLGTGPARLQYGPDWLAAATAPELTALGATLAPDYDPATHWPPAETPNGWGIPVGKTAAEMQAGAVAGLESARALRRAAVDQAVVERLQAGYPDPATGLHVDIYPDGRRADMAGLVSAALIAQSGAAPWSEAYSQGWIAKENDRIPLPTPEAGIALAGAAGDWYARIRQHGRDLKDAINLAADPAAVDIAAGWPT